MGASSTGRRDAAFGAAVALVAAAIGAGTALIATNRQIESQAEQSTMEFIRLQQTENYAKFLADYLAARERLEKSVVESAILRTGNFDVNDPLWQEYLTLDRTLRVTGNVMRIIGDTDVYTHALELSVPVFELSNTLHALPAGDITGANAAWTKYQDWSVNESQEDLAEFGSEARRDILRD